MNIALGEKILGGSFSYFLDGSTRDVAHNDPYVLDLDGDGVDEVLIAGLETQPNTPAAFSPISVQVFGWKNGLFQNLTDTLMPGDVNDVGGVGSVAVGDFDGNGFSDVFLSSYADMTHSLSAYALMNNGSAFTKANLGVVEAWQHGAAAADINQDGYMDIFSTGYGEQAFRVYMGSPTGLVTYTLSSWAGGSGVALGDFLGNGTVSVILTDAYQETGADTVLYRMWVSETERTVSLSEVRALPQPRLENMATSSNESHDVRALPVDFSGDGLLDVVIFSRAWWDGSQWPLESAIQFLQNQGSGRFTDTTEQILTTAITEAMIPYAPVASDYDLNGRLDLYVDGTSWTGVHNSAAFLMQDSDGRFLDVGRSDISSAISSRGGISTVARGADGGHYVISLEASGGVGTVYSQSVRFPEREGSETLRGTASNDVIYGFGGDDILYATSGVDLYDLGDGLDTIIFEKPSVDLTFTKSASSWDIVNSSGDHYTIYAAERFVMSDRSFALDLDGHAGEVARLLGAVFGADSVGNAEYVGIGLDLLDGGMSYTDLAALAVSVTGKSSSTDVCNLLWENVIGTTATSADIAPFKAMLDSGQLGIGQLTTLAADTSFNTGNIDLVGLAQTGLEYL